MLLSQVDHHYKESGLDNVFLMNIDSYNCDECNEKVVCIPELGELSRAIGRALLKKPSLLNGKEIRFLRKNMGLKALQLKEMIGIDNSTISRWENGTQKIAPSHDRLIRVVYANFMGIPGRQIKSLITDRFKNIEAIESMTPLYQIDTKNRLLTNVA